MGINSSQYQDHVTSLRIKKHKLCFVLPETTFQYKIMSSWKQDCLISTEGIPVLAK